MRGCHDYYKTPRGHHSCSGNSNDGWNVTGTTRTFTMVVSGAIPWDKIQEFFEKYLG